MGVRVCEQIRTRLFLRWGAKINFPNQVPKQTLLVKGCALSLERRGSFLPTLEMADFSDKNHLLQISSLSLCRYPLKPPS
jgi:hypothetical protein